MKTLNNYIVEHLEYSTFPITERLHITKQTRGYSCQPKNVKELRKILENRLAEDKNADLNDIDISNIKYFYNSDTSTGLFEGLDPHNIDISLWDVSNVEDMSFMFDGCENFNCNLSDWDVSNVEDMQYMFNNCKKFKGKGLDKWDPVNCTDMYGMFTGCTVINNSPKWYKQ